MHDTNPIDRQQATGDHESAARGAWWRLPLLFILVLVAIIVVRTSRQPVRDSRQGDSRRADAVTVEGKTVALAIDFSDGRRREFDAVPWHPGMTVDDLMTAASRNPEGIRYTVSGDGQLTLLGSIDGVANQLGGGRNWIYRVNDKLADRSLAIYELKPGDRVLWTFSENE
ncbi:MAG: DUF4430 domain-containing protein [Pirellulales bacterium]